MEIATRVFWGVLLSSGVVHAAEPAQRGSAPERQENRPKTEQTRPAADMKADHSQMGGMGRMHGMMMGGMSCAEMMGMAKVTVENTKDGAVVRLTATDKASVEHVQQMAQMMKTCMGGEGDRPKR